MISWLLSSLIPLSIILIILLLIRQPLRKSTDAHTVYNLWVLLPLTLIIYSLPLPWHYVSELNNASMQTFLVQPTKNVNQHLADYSQLNQGVLWLWLTGTLSLITYWIINHFTSYTQLSMSVLLADKLSVEVKKSIPPKLSIKQSDHIYSPLLIGVFKQTLVIPEDFCELYNSEQQALIIEHEVCHFSHYHMWANQFALMLLALFWFHPLAWRAYALFRQDQEHSCDQVVLARKQTKSRIQYCKALVLAAETSPPNAFTLLSFKQNGEQNFMFNRIEQIKKMTPTTRFMNTAKLVIVTLTSTALLAGVSYAGNHLKQTDAIEQALINVHPVHRIEPKYPIQAAKDGIEGSVVLKFDIKGDGNVTNVEVVNGKPAYVFDKTALTALKQWRYKATGKTTKNLLVQLDYLMDDSSAQPEPLIERIKVKN